METKQLPMNLDAVWRLTEQHYLVSVLLTQQALQSPCSSQHIHCENLDVVWGYFSGELVQRDFLQHFQSERKKQIYTFQQLTAICQDKQTNQPDMLCLCSFKVEFTIKHSQRRILPVVSDSSSRSDLSGHFQLHSAWLHFRHSPHQRERVDH